MWTEGGVVRDLEELHQRVTKEINDTRNDEMAQFVQEKRRTSEEANNRANASLKEAKDRGQDVDKLDAFYKKLAAERDDELKEIKKKYPAEEGVEKHIAAEEFRARGLEAALMPEEARALPPSYAGVFSTKDERDKLSGGTGTEVYNFNIIDAYAWASGAGNGWFGSGAGSYQVWAEWGYWYWVPTTKFYGITTHNAFRGYYIVRSFDDWWISAYSRAVVSSWVDVWQYNWKGWSTVNALDVGADNIDVNQRFDTDRHHYYSALLAGGDWAYVRNVVGLYVYARAGGSYSELNFAAGAANYLSAPHVHIV